MFVGNHEHTLDGKGRLVLPSRFRPKLPEGGYLSPSGEGLALYPAAAFEAMVARLTERVRAGDVDPDALLGLAANADEVRPDAQGRILLPPRLRELAGLSGEVVVVGAFDHIQIWATDRWRNRERDITGQAQNAVGRGQGI